jgi:putative ABC transport system permease protein
MVRAARGLRRSPGFAITAVSALALGIGLATAVFTAANTLLVRRLPVADQDRVVMLSGESRDRKVQNWPLSYADAREFAAHSRSLARAGLFVFPGTIHVPVDVGGTTERYGFALVSGDFFDVLGATPVLGRALRREDDVVGASPAVVLSYRAWQDRFGGAPDVIGRSVVAQVNDENFKIVGVMPQGLDFPRGVDVWSAERATVPGGDMTNVEIDMVGRLAPTSTVEAAGDELSAFFAQSAGSKRMLHGAARALPELVVGDLRAAIVAFVAAVGLLLLITCINVANLLLVRGVGRAKEMAVRSALGANRARLVVHLLGESSLLAIGGGALGALVAAGALRVFVALAPPGFPRIDELHIDGAALASSALVTIGAMLLFAMAPAFLTSGVDVVEVLHSGHRHGDNRRFRRLSDLLVTGQVALSVVVLSAAALVARSLINLERANLSLESSRVLIAELSVRYRYYDTAPKQLAAIERLLPAIAASPGVRSVSPVVAAPFSVVAWDGIPRREGQTAPQAKNNPVLNMELVAPSYFATFGLPVLQGRAFSADDRRGSTQVVMLSESAARSYWPGQNPIGRRLAMGSKADSMSTVVGVVPDTRYRDLRVARPTIYFPLAQSAFPFAPTSLAISTTGDPASIVPSLRRVLAETAPGMSLVRAAPFDAYLSGPLAQPRLDATLLFVFAAAAVLLSAIGLFGVLATSVRQRTREIGVRLALGASPAAVAALVLRRALVIGSVGVTSGLAIVVLTNHWVASLLFGVSSTDTATLAVVAVFVLGVAGLASLLPARLSASVDPVVALRAE